MPKSARSFGRKAGSSPTCPAHMSCWPTFSMRSMRARKRPGLWRRPVASAHEIEQSFGVWISYLTEAYFHLERNDDAAAIAPLRRGLKVGREVGLFGILPRLTDMFEKVSAKALKEGIEIDHVRELIRRNRLAPDPANPDLEQWPWAVKVHTLGRFGLLVDDCPIEFGRKVQQKPLALLKALVALGGRDVPEGQLAELLWPEADGDLAHHSFEVALSRLRKILGNEEILVLKEGRLSLSNRQCWVDVWAFARSLGQAEKARKEGKGPEAIRLFEKALSLYRGPFLLSEEMTCAASPREKLRSGFLRAVALLGQCYEDGERWEEAVTCYGKGIEADDLAEELYRRLMVCHIRQGREAEALSVYRRCRKTLSSVLGVDPSTETRAIADSLGRSPADLLPRHTPGLGKPLRKVFRRVSPVIFPHHFSSESVGNP